MTKKTTFFLPLISLIILFSCDSNTDDTATYFGGKIINPKSKNVILYSFEEAVDTLSLDNENKFLVKLESLKEGMYHFMHGNEYQYIYLEPKDSLMLRLNTWDFDESLVFAGKGAERNNILIDCFLEEEKENKIFYPFYKLQPKEYKIKVDSILALKLDTYEKYIKSHANETDGFKEILKVALSYPIYSKIERYPIKYAYHSNTNSFPKVDENFYDYRKNVNTDNSSLMYYSPYSNYIINFLYNKTYSLGYAPNMSDYSEEFTMDLLKVIDTEIKSNSIKNPLLKQTVIGHFYRKSSCNINSKAFDRFLKLSTDDKDKEQIRKLISDNNALPKDEGIPDFAVINYNNAQQSIKDIIKGSNTMLFFWSPEYYDQSYIVSRINYLSKNYPNVKFTLIKTEGEKTKRIEKLDIKNQFYIDTNSTAHKFLTSKMPRSVLVDKHGKVVNGYASISSSNLNHYLKDLNKN